MKGATQGSGLQFGSRARRNTTVSTGETSPQSAPPGSRSRPQVTRSLRSNPARLGMRAQGAAIGISPSATAPHGRRPSLAPSRADFHPSGMKRLDPEVLVAHLRPLLRTASSLCDSRETAEDLVQDTFAKILARPRFLRDGNERAYLMQALRNTFITSRRTAARHPRVVTSLEELDPADRRTAARPEDAVITAQVLPAIAQLPESFRLALVAVDVAGLSYREAAAALGASEATITTRLYRARQRVARELDPEQFDVGQANGTRGTRARPAEGLHQHQGAAPGRHAVAYESPGRGLRVQ
jgi:RNA polymerase sigma-70 factor, ECF subfamily